MSVADEDFTELARHHVELEHIAWQMADVLRKECRAHPDVLRTQLHMARQTLRLAADRTGDTEPGSLDYYEREGRLRRISRLERELAIRTLVDAFDAHQWPDLSEAI